MSDPTLPLTVTEWEEWGDPLHDPEAYVTIGAYSPYDNVQTQAYPPMLITAGLNDPRVAYWEPAKWVAKLRAFKTYYFVSRWSSNNLSVFEAIQPVTLPYYDNRMFEFMCKVPEKYLANRQLQIAYIQQNAPYLAKITWQGQRPFNLNTYHLNKSPYNLPYRVYNKLRRITSNKKQIQRNWELQFLGNQNDNQLKKYLFESDLDSLVPKKVIQQFFTNFKEHDAVKYSHPVSMLLTLTLFNQKFHKFLY